MGALRYAGVSWPPPVDLRRRLPPLRLVAAIPHTLARMLPTIRVDVDIDDGVASLGSDLVLSLRAWPRLPGGGQAVHLHLVLLGGVRGSRGGYHRQARARLG